LDEPPEKTPQEPLAPSATRGSLKLAWGVAGVLLVALAALGIVNWLRPKPQDPIAVRFNLPLPEGTTERHTPGITASAVASPDGRNICMTASGADGVEALWVRPLGEPLPHRLDKTDGANSPFWSPDGQTIAYFADDKLKKVAVAGGSPQTICAAPHSAAAMPMEAGGAWNSDGVIVFSTGADSPLMRVMATGGTANPITRLDASAGETRHAFPQFLPDGRHILYFAGNSDQSKAAIYVQELGSPDRVMVMRNSLLGAWAPPGYLLFAKGTTLYAQRIDARSFQLSGDPVSVAENVRAHDPSGTTNFNISGGILTYRASDAFVVGQLAWYGRDGKRLESVGKRAVYTSVRMSLDDRIAEVSIGPIGNADVWTIDLATGAMRRATSNGHVTFVLGPLSPDSQRMAVNLGSSQGILEAGPTGGNTRVLGPPPLYADDWSPDGQFLLCRDVNGDHWSLLRADGSQQIQAIGNGIRGFQIRFAPDGKSVAYVSSASGRGEVVVSSFPSFAAKRQISIDGGVHPVWRKDGQELFFQALDGRVMSAEIRTAGGKIEAGIPRPLFKAQYQQAAASGSYHYWPAPDGKRFLVLERENAADAQTIVVLNWAATLRE
ncbi:MAG TPA: hypothetical protein VML19_25420, partial [Verrucomicrobiae bacterium]|nr:hypothetical protein [Verrucomicrobiae bacterium]